MSVDGLRESRRGELGKELVGSHPSQDRLYHWFKSNDYGRILSDNNAYIKDKRMVCLSYRSEFEVIRNFCVPVRPEKVDMFSRIGGRPTGANVRSPLAWAASAEDNKVDEAD